MYARLTAILFFFITVYNSKVHSTPVDSIAFSKFMYMVSRQNDSVKTLSTVMKTITEVKISTNQQKSSTTKDTSINKIWAIFPDKFRTEMKSNNASMLTLRNGLKMLVIDDSSGTRKVLDEIETKPDGVLVNTKRLLESLHGTPSFTVQKGDSIAILEGEFNYNGVIKQSQMICNLKTNQISEITMKGSTETTMKLDYTKVNGLDCIMRITLTGGNNDASIKVVVLFDSIKINTKLPLDLFNIEIVKR